VKSVLAIAKNLLSDVEDFKYLLTYSFSQDHLELYFSHIRRRFGNNNNPNVMQLKTAMKQLLLKNSIDTSPSSNCIAFDDNALSGNIFEIKWSRKKKADLFRDEFPEENIDDEEEEASLEDGLFNEINSLDSQSIDEIHEEYILYYVSGFVARSLKKKISMKCDTCINRLTKSQNEQEHDYVLRSNI
jgi:hypothetical protein